MALPKFTDDVNIHQSLSNTPNATEGYTPLQIKVLYDSAVNLIKTWINNVLTVEVDAHINALTAHATTADIAYYVNASTGNDSNNGLASGTALLTVQAAINKLPQIINHNITINVAAGTYNEDIVISGFIGKGSISILGDTIVSDSYIIRSITILKCTLNSIIRGIKVTKTNGDGISVNLSRYVDINVCKCSDASANSGIFASNAEVKIRNSVISNRTIAIYSNTMSTIMSENNTGTGNTFALYCENASKIGKTGTQPTATTAEYANRGGQII